MATGRAYCPLSSDLMWRCVASLLWSGLLYNKHLIFKRPNHVATSSLPSSVRTLVVPPSTFVAFTPTSTSSFICRCSFAFCPLSAVAVNRFAITYNVPSQPQLTWPYTPLPAPLFFLPSSFAFAFPLYVFLQIGIVDCPSSATAPPFCCSLADCGELFFNPLSFRLCSLSSLARPNYSHRL